MSSQDQINTAMNGGSLNISEQRKKELKQLFPGVFTETINNAGELIETIDFERLKAELGEFSEIYDSRRERYGMDWPGKRDCLRLIQQQSCATLKPCREESVDFDKTQNLFIEGDNLEVLKLLQKSYYGQVKMIYIDPPYNTGKEFIYPDNFSESLDTYLKYAGLKDSEGRTFSTNTANEGRFHTKWLNMMYPRLYLARNLLREDGVIFISIDDNEVENLRRMCDEIFGEENFKSDIAWQKRYTRSNNTVDFTTMVEHIIVYARSDKFLVNLLPRSSEADARYSNPDNDPRGVWKGASFLNPATPSERPNLCYKITNPNTGEEAFPTTNAWRRSKEEFENLSKDGRLYWGRDGKSAIPSVKMFLSEARGLTPVNFWPHEYAGNTDDGTSDLEKIVGGKLFDNPKPVRLIRRMLEHGCNEDSIILDFFSGSGTSMQAVFELNAEIRAGHKFVCVQLPEYTDKDSSAYTHGYSTIADIAKARARNICKNLRSDVQARLNLHGEREVDYGFKVMKLDKSNFKPWQSPDKTISDEALIHQMELAVDHIDPNASQEDLLYELLLKAGLKPTEVIEQIELAGHKVFSVSGGELLVHLENAIDQPLIDAVLEMAPSQFICLDKAFHGNDQLKTNAVKTFANFNQGKEKIDRIEFKTV